MLPTSCLFVALGGGLGTFLRFIVTLSTAPWSRHFPWGTVIAVNGAGSFAMGCFSALTGPVGRVHVSENCRLFVMVGLCGGYTTFSTFSLQTFDLLRSGDWERASLNILASLALCLGAVALGHFLTLRLMT